MSQENKFKKYKHPEQHMSHVPCRVSHVPCHTSRGFSLIEVLVTLFVLSAGLVGVSVLMTVNIKNSENSKNQIIASQLAQEGIEVVRNKKENVSDIIMENLPAGSHSDYRIDKDMPFINNGADKRLYLNSGFYTHTDAGTATKFYRRIDLVINGSKLPAPSTREITVKSYVTWNNVGFAAMNAAMGGLSANCNIGNKCVPIVSKMPDIN